MTKRIVYGAALALMIVALMAPTASANCGTSKSVSTYNPVTGNFNYWHTTLSNPTLVAKMWQPGGADVTGSCNTSPGILYFAATPGDIGVHANLADACVQPAAACASGQLAIMATATGTITQAGPDLGKQGTEFLVSQTPETPGGGNTFDFSTYGNHGLGVMPRPRITGSSRAGSTVNTTVSAPALNDPTINPVSPLYEGTAPLITGYNILSKLANADPGRNASAYDTGPNLAASSGGPASGPVPIDCTGGSPALGRRFVVTQLVTPQGPSPTVSQAVIVSCDGSLADPGKYRIVKPKVVQNSKAKQN